MRTLSICIPTYNRVDQLEELVKSLLEVRSNDFEVVITDNCSTDNTLDMLNAIKDDRLVVYKNKSPEPALYNMIVSIFNASGKYALYCNDRDIIYTEQLLPFIEFLKNHQYSYIHLPQSKKKGKPSYKLDEYEKGLDSIIHHHFNAHPTGMVYNTEILKKKLNKENYRQYVENIYTVNYLHQDLVIYEKSAKFDICLWNLPPSKFLVKSKSGTVYRNQLFFDSDRTTLNMIAEVKHLIGNPYFKFTPNQQKMLILIIFSSFKNMLMLEKQYYANERICTHYNIKTRYISLFVMKDVYNKYSMECDNVLRSTAFYDELKEEWAVLRKNFSKSLFRDYIVCVKNIFAIRIKQKLFSQYTH